MTVSGAERFPMRYLLLALTLTAVAAAGCRSETEAPGGPRLVEVAPAAAAPGDLVTVIGSGLGRSGMLFLGDVRVEASSWSDREIHVTVPPLPPGTVTLFVVTGEKSNELEFEVLEAPAARPPSLTSVALGAGPFYTNDTLVAKPAGWKSESGAEPDYAYAWSVNGTAAVGFGDSLPGYAFQKGDRVQVRVTPREGDREGEPVDSNTIVIANARPVVDSVRLGAGPVDVTGTLTLAGVGVSDLDYDVITLAHQWVVNGTPLPSETGATLAAAGLAKGDSVLLRVRPFDGEDHGAWVDSGAIVIQNAVPAVAGVTFAADGYTAGEAVIAVPHGATDPDGDALSWQFAWTRDGVALDGVETDTLPGGLTTRGSTVAVRARPFDGESYGEWSESAQTVIANAPPALASVSIAGGPFQTDDTLTAVPSGWSDADDDTPGYEFAWTVNGLPVPGEIAATLGGNRFEKGDVVAVAARPFDGLSFGAWVDSVPVVIENSPPAFPQFASAVLGSGYGADAVIGVLVTGWSDPDGDVPGYRFEWSVNGTAVTDVADAALSGEYFARGDVVRVRVWPFDGESSGDPIDSNETVIVNSAPRLTAVTLGAGPFRTETTLSPAELQVEDPDGDALTFAYRWSVNGSALAVTTASLDPSWFHKGDTVTVAVQAFDGAAYSEWLESAAVTIVNTPPTLASASLGTGPFRTNDTLSVTVSGWFDADGDTAGYGYAWFVNGVTVAGETAASLSGTHFSRGDEVVCAVTPHDGEESGIAVLSNFVPIDNTLPEALALSLTPATAYTTTDLIAQWTFADDDQQVDAGSAVRWFRNGTRENTLDDELALPAAQTAKGEVWHFEVTPWDGIDWGATVTSSAVLILNTPPTLAAFSIGEGPFYRDSVLSVPPLTAEDLDNDGQTYVYRWLADGTEVGTTSTLSGAVLTRGTAIQAAARAFDGEAYSEWAYGNVVTIANSPPSITGVTLSAAVLGAGDPIAVAGIFGWQDIDGDTPGYTYEWYVNGGLVADVAASAFPAGRLAEGDEIFARVRPADGIDTGNPVDSAVLLVLPRPAIDSLSASASYYPAIVTASGQNFGAAQGTGQVLVGGVAAAIVSWSSTVIEFTVPPGAPGGAVEVIVRADTGLESAPAGLTLLPRLVAVTPSAGWTNATVAATGYHFGSPQGSGELHFNGAPAAVFAWSNAAIDFQVPVGLASGTYDVAVQSGVAFSNSVTFAIIPTPLETPVNLTAVSGAVGEATVTWDDTNWAESGYQVERRTTDSTFTVVATLPADSALFQDTGLMPGAEYTYRVIAFNGPELSPYSNADTATVRGGTFAPVSLAAGGNHTCAIVEDGRVRCWGWNYHGQLGDGTTERAPVATTVKGISGVVQLAAGSNHTCALTGDGAVTCWGENSFGQLGNGTQIGTLTPMASSFTAGVEAITAGDYHMCALLQTGALHCWGDNAYGQLGDGSTTTRTSPVTVSGLSSGVAGVDAGGIHTCAVLDTGGVKCWGYNGGGRLGNGSTATSYLPVNVSGLSGATAVSAGGSQSCAIAGGALYCWGLGGLGQTGDGAYTNRNVPVSVLGMGSGVTQITTGTLHTCALKSDGAVYCWGYNSNGQVADESFAKTGFPFRVALPLRTSAVFGGDYHTCALQVTGEVDCWGMNSEGELGADYLSVRGAPAPVVGTETPAALFADAFDSGTADAADWALLQGDAAVSGLYAHSASYALTLGAGGSASTVLFDASSCAQGVRWQYYGKRGPEAPGADVALLLRYRPSAGGWLTADEWSGSGGVDSDFIFRTGTLPGDAAHTELQFEFSNSSATAGQDHFRVDDFVVECAEPAPQYPVSVFYDDMEAGDNGWAAVSLAGTIKWHRIAEPTCSPSASSPSASWYFGTDATCSFAATNRVAGRLISPPVFDLVENAELSFHWRKGTECTSCDYDKATVQISADQGATWTQVLQVNYNSASWLPMTGISLAAWAGQDIRIGFKFDSVDGASNSFLGWMIDNVRIAGAATTPLTVGNMSDTTATYPSTVTVSGTGFGSVQGTGSVTVGGVTATIVSWSDTSIEFQIPNGASLGEQTVVVTNDSGASASGTTPISIVPAIYAVTPSSVAPGESVTLSGWNFGTLDDSSQVMIDDAFISPDSWGNVSITFTVPLEAAEQSYSVVVVVGGQTSNALTLTVAVPAVIPTRKVAVMWQWGASAPSYFAGTFVNEASAFETVYNADPEGRFEATVVANFDFLWAYDVLVLPDEPVPDADLAKVAEWFESGGKVIVAIDSAASYAFYSGYLAPEAAGTSGHFTRWADVSGTDDQEVSVADPATAGYTVGQVLSSESDKAVLIRSILPEDVVVLTERASNPEYVYAAYRDVSSVGSRIVFLGQSAVLPDAGNLIRNVSIAPLATRVLFADDFESGTLAKWPQTAGGAYVTTDYGASGYKSVKLGGDSSSIQTHALDTTVCPLGIRWSYRVKRGPDAPETDDYLSVSYAYDTYYGFIPVDEVFGNSAVDSEFTVREGIITAVDAYHDAFTLLFQSFGSAWGTDDFYVDDVVIRCENPPSSTGGSGEQVVFFDDMESGPNGWTHASLGSEDLWHQHAGTCTPPGGELTTSWYFGTASCTYEGSGPVGGRLLSPTIASLPGSAVLNFRYYRQTECDSCTYDITRVLVSIDGGGSFTVLQTITGLPAGWVDSGPIDLSSLAGYDIQLAFEFESIDITANNYFGWMIDDVSVTAPPSTADVDNYVVRPAPYSWVSDADSGQGVLLFGVGNDDGIIGISLPFTVKLYATEYDTLSVSSNGFVSFGTQTDHGCCGGTLPTTQLPQTIMLNWRDLYLGSGAEIRYAITGTAPDRRVVVSYLNVGNCCSGDLPGNFQLVIDEGSNIFLVQYGAIQSVGEGGINQGDGVTYTGWTPAFQTAYSVGP